MGILNDAINKKLKETYGNDYDKITAKVHTPEPVVVKDSEEIPEIYYTHKWLDKVVLNHRFAVSDNVDKVNKILEALNRRKGYCPCGGMGAQFKCPCDIMRNHGICKCGLFQSVEDRNIKSGASVGKINE